MAKKVEVNITKDGVSVDVIKWNEKLNTWVVVTEIRVIKKK